MTEKEQIEAVTKDMDYINLIENPSEEVQIASVKEWGATIQNIKNPSEAVQLVAVSEDPSQIEFIENPSYGARLVAIGKDSDLIKVINVDDLDPSQLHKYFELALEPIKTPSELVVNIHELDDIFLKSCIQKWGYEALEYTRVTQDNIDMFNGLEADLLNWVLNDTKKNSKKIKRYMIEYPRFEFINKELSIYLEAEDLVEVSLKGIKIDEVEIDPTILKEYKKLMLEEA